MASIIPLALKLKAISVATRVTTPSQADVIDRFIEHLIRTEAGAEAPRIGDVMPNFLLPDQDGHLVALEKLLGAGPVVISFLRGHWCPFCTTTAAALNQVHRQAADLGAQVVAITPERRPYSRELGALAGGDRFRVLTDMDSGYALGLNLAVWFEDAMAKVLTSSGHDIPVFNGSDGWVLPIPATFVLDRDGRIVERHVNPDWRERADPNVVVAALKKLASTAGG